MPDNLSENHPLEITIRGPKGPSGKTTLQLLIAELLRRNGHVVTCSESGKGSRGKQFQRLVASHHRLTNLDALRPMTINIDVATEA